MPDEQVAVLEQLRHAPLLPGDLPRLALPLFAGSAAPLLGDLCSHLFAELRQGVQDRLGDLIEDVELTNLVRDLRPRLSRWALNWRRKAKTFL
jgi:hypothetical protein